MLVLPGLHGLGDRSLERHEIHQRAAAFVERTANGRFRQVTVAVPKRVIALAVKRKVVFRGEFAGVQSVSGAEWNLQSKKKAPPFQYSAKKSARSCSRTRWIGQLFRYPLVNVTSEILRRDRLIREARHLAIQVLVIEFAS